MYLGIEIGGTKLQLGVGDGQPGALAAFERRAIDPRHGAQGILTHIERVGADLVHRFHVEAIGVGFGGPVDSQRGVVTKSHQIEGWDGFPLGPWCQDRLGRPTVLGNDCDSATLAEAHHGAGQGYQRVFYVTVGTGVGGGFVVDGRLQGQSRPAIAEIGHLRPGPTSRSSAATVESIASGWGIVAAVRRRLEPWLEPVPSTTGPGAAQRQPVTLAKRLTHLQQAGRRHESDLLERCHGALDTLTAQSIADAAADGNAIARRTLARATECLGWAVAQVITLLAPEIVVIGGGVSLMPAQLFLEPVRRRTRQYVFPPLADSYQIVPPALGEQVVVHGAVLLAQTHGSTR